MCKENNGIEISEIKKTFFEMTNTVGSSEDIKFNSSITCSQSHHKTININELNQKYNVNEINNSHPNFNSDNSNNSLNENIPIYNINNEDQRNINNESDERILDNFNQSRNVRLPLNTLFVQIPNINQYNSMLMESVEKEFEKNRKVELKVNLHESGINNPLKNMIKISESIVGSNNEEIIKKLNNSNEPNFDEVDNYFL
jgi:hypothetical protein